MRQELPTGESRHREEVDEMGQLFDIIQEHMDAQPYGVSQRKIAERLGVSPTTLKNWR